MSPRSIPAPAGAPRSVPAPAGAPGSAAPRTIPAPAGAPGATARPVPAPVGAPGPRSTGPAPGSGPRPAVPAPPGAPRPPAIAPPAPASTSGVLTPPLPAAAAPRPSAPGAGPSFPGAARTAGHGPTSASGAIAAPAPPPLSTAPLPESPSPLPRTGNLDALTPQQTQAVAQFVEEMEAQDYFQVLGLPPTATRGDIKKAFYRDSRTYHPDRVFHLADEAAKQDINSIYKRITEAYYVLRDDAKRAKYLTDLNGPERASKLRFTEASEAEQKAEAKKVVEDEFGTVPKARPFFKSALQDIERQNWGSAERNLKMGLTYEPGAARFKEKLAQVQKKLDDQRRASGDAFKIK
ncbi:MAG: DnaJ domain-containing protein [Myxococcales bacterium]|nr:DnaJ domain-containing protein [Myxococcales bacterium]